MRELRTKKLMTIRALAAAANVAPRTIVSVEAGSVLPRFTTMRKIAAALGVKPAEVDEFSVAIEQAGKGLAA